MNSDHVSTPGLYRTRTKNHCDPEEGGEEVHVMIAALMRVRQIFSPGAKVPVTPLDFAKRVRCRCMS